MTPPQYPAYDGSQLCAQTDPHLFMPEYNGASPREAKKLCASCPFLEECREFAMWHDVDGVWGGTTLHVRVRERTRRGIKLADPERPGSLRDQILAADPAIPSGALARQLGCSDKTVQRHRKAQREQEAA